MTISTGAEPRRPMSKEHQQEGAGPAGPRPFHESDRGRGLVTESAWQGAGESPKHVHIKLDYRGVLCVQRPNGEGELR